MSGSHFWPVEQYSHPPEREKISEEGMQQLQINKYTGHSFEKINSHHEKNVHTICNLQHINCYLSDCFFSHVSSSLVWLLCVWKKHSDICKQKPDESLIQKPTSPPSIKEPISLIKMKQHNYVLYISVLTSSHMHLCCQRVWSICVVSVYLAACSCIYLFIFNV